MRKIIGWILGAIGVVILGLVGWLYFKSDKLVNKFLDKDDE